jgi:hypothetical protein
MEMLATAHIPEIDLDEAEKCPKHHLAQSIIASHYRFYRQKKIEKNRVADVALKVMARDLN